MNPIKIKKSVTNLQKNIDTVSRICYHNSNDTVSCFICKGEHKMPKISKEDVNSRKEQIVNACNELYKTMSFKEITIKEIGNHIPFTRTTIYSYFQTKEEIFLALLQREYEFWVDDLNSLLEENDSLTPDELSDKLAKTLEKRVLLLKLMSMNNFDIEANSRIENLTEFKKAYGDSIKTVKKCLDKFCTNKTDFEKQTILYSFFPFMFGIYPYTFVTDKQKRAMETNNINFVYHSIYDLTYNFLKKIL